MKQYDVEVLEIRPFTRQVYANSPEEAIAQAKAFYGNRIAIDGEPTVKRVCSIQWRAKILDAKATGWYDDETTYDYDRDEELGPFNSKEEACIAALKACPAWPVAFEEGRVSGELRWYQETGYGNHGENYREVTVFARPGEVLPLETPAAKPALEPEFAN
jgi:hypothetical protein